MGTERHTPAAAKMGSALLGGPSADDYETCPRATTNGLPAWRRHVQGRIAKNVLLKEPPCPAGFPSGTPA